MNRGVWLFPARGSRRSNAEVAGGPSEAPEMRSESFRLVPGVDASIEADGDFEDEYVDLALL
ncbi:MAG: hypothetical protein INE96_13245, partial [Phenylobacterium sp.]|nr:hypothetical protein [Phenylobacterium sp.]